MQTHQAPFRVLFSNDTTNIQTCVSPYHAAGEPFRPEMLQATVDEVAQHGVQAHLIQLAHGQVPWYRSKLYPMSEHHRWWKEYFGVDPIPDAFHCDSVHQYILDGGDLLQVFIERCRQTGQSPFVSLRLNDVHHVENVNTPGNTRGIHAISRFYAEHLQYRLGSDLNDWNQKTLNWAFPEVREYMLALIEEQCEGYDLDGLELDYMRFPSFFDQEHTTLAQRREIMRDFITRVRAVLDRTVREGRHRWLCVRIPCYLSVYDRLGIDLPAWVDAGVEMINLSAHYFTEQQTDLAKIRSLAPEAALYLEMTHCTAVGRRLERGYDNFTFRRTTDEQFYTTAHLAYARGADGVSAFNFVYYREHGTSGRGPFNEPPFHVFERLGDPTWLAQQPQHYILGNVWDQPHVPGRPLPRDMAAGQVAAFTLDMAPPQRGWQRAGRLRIQGETSLGNSRWAAHLNGVPLAPTDDVSEPYPNPYRPLLGAPEDHRAWVAPVDLLRDGRNELEIRMLDRSGVHKLVFLDLAIV